ncbi:MAG: ESPR domain-containing protein [Neisseria sp.]|nr:ESPR domain-containing protein [Neisseria sp.]
MNHVYRIIWNAALGVWQCVAEIARAQGKEKASKQASNYTRLTLQAA